MVEDRARAETRKSVMSEKAIMISGRRKPLPLLEFPLLAKMVGDFIDGKNDGQSDRAYD